MQEFMRGAASDLSGIAGLLGNIDPSNPESFRSIVDDPGAILEVDLPRSAHGSPVSWPR